MSEEPAVPDNERLESWKAIAAYLNRDARTVMRWEKSEGLPVHRQRHLSRSSIYAFPRELDAWRAQRRLDSPAARAPERTLRPVLVAAMLALGILTAGGGQFTGPLNARQSGPIDRLLRWAGEPSMAADESMSPDGRYVAYVDMANRELSIRDLRSGRSNTLTKIARVGGFVDTPRISNDGRHVAFYSSDKNHVDGIWLLPVDATDAASPRRVADGTLAPLQWSADDRQLLVTAGRDDGSTDIAIATIEGGVRVVKNVPFPGTGDFLAMSPDGRFIAYDQRAEPKHRQRDIWLTSIANGATVPVLSGPTFDEVIAWSGDGNYLLFHSDRVGSRGDGLWALPIRAGAPTGDPILLKAGFRGTAVTLTRAGTLFFESYGQKVDDLLIASLNIEAGAAKQIPQAASHDQVAPSRRPRWSRDGQWFMYETRRPGGPVISMRMLKTGVVTEVPLELAYVSTFDLSPDGRKIVCRGNDLEGHTGIFIVDTSTAAVEPVVLWQENVTRQFVPQFSSDGRSVTYVVGDYHGNNKYVERSLEPGVERVIATPPTGNGNYLRASPDGRFLLTYLETRSPAQVALRVYDLVTRQTREVFRVERGTAFTTEDGVQWMPDSRAIVANVRGAGENVRELWWIPVDGGQPRRLEVGVNNVVDSGIAIDRDGTHIAFVAGDPVPSKATTLHYEFRLLEHFLPERK